MEDIPAKKGGEACQFTMHPHARITHTFSNFSFIGLGFFAVIASAISYPIWKAISLLFPGRWINRLSVSPYTTCAPHLGVEWIKAMAYPQEDLEAQMNCIFWIAFGWNNLHLFKRFPPVLNDCISHLDVRHSTGEAGWGITIRNVLFHFRTRKATMD